MASIRKSNDEKSSAMYVVEDAHSEPATIGQFYDARDKSYHLAIYKPYKEPPREFLCGDWPSSSRFVVSKCDYQRMQVCKACFERLALYWQSFINTRGDNS